MRLMKYIQRKIIEGLSYTNGWSIEQSKYEKICEKIGFKIEDYIFSKSFFLRDNHNKLRRVVPLDNLFPCDDALCESSEVKE